MEEYANKNYDKFSLLRKIYFGIFWLHLCISTPVNSLYNFYCVLATSWKIKEMRARRREAEAERERERERRSSEMF